MITQATLKELLNYSPETGEFTWLKSIGGKSKTGLLAGTLNSLGYRKIIIWGKEYKAHRLAWLYTHGSFPEGQIDHINGVRKDNKIDNLRAVTNAENTRNGKRRCTNTSGVTGVSWFKLNEAWGAYINDNGKKLFLGLFEDLFSAVAARKTAEIKYDYHPNHGRGV
jgi:hypothetical protein